jgi:hypothetical protein
MAGLPPWERPIRDHLPAHCCCHVFTSACPIDCLQVVLGTATFHALARAERAPFGPPATVGQVLEHLRAGRLGQAAGLGPRRLGEIQAGLVMAGLALSDVTPPVQGLPPERGGGPVCVSDEEESPPC